MGGAKQSTGEHMAQGNITSHVLTNMTKTRKHMASKGKTLSKNYKIVHTCC